MAKWQANRKDRRTQRTGQDRTVMQTGHTNKWTNKPNRTRCHSKWSPAHAAYE